MAKGSSRGWSVARMEARGREAGYLLRSRPAHAGLKLRKVRFSGARSLGANLPAPEPRLFVNAPEKKRC